MIDYKNERLDNGFSHVSYFMHVEMSKTKFASQTKEIYIYRVTS